MSRTRTMTILIVLTSHGDLAGLRPTGYYHSEVTTLGECSPTYLAATHVPNVDRRSQLMTTTVE